jgi:hypothetical protein
MQDVVPFRIYVEMHVDARILATWAFNVKYEYQCALRKPQHKEN